MAHNIKFNYKRIKTWCPLINLGERNQYYRNKASLKPHWIVTSRRNAAARSFPTREMTARVFVNFETEQQNQNRGWWRNDCLSLLSVDRSCLVSWTLQNIKCNYKWIRRSCCTVHVAPRSRWSRFILLNRNWTAEHRVSQRELNEPLVHSGCGDGV